MATSNPNYGGYTAPSGVTTRDQVREIQRQLNAQGANLKVDGLWGAKTDAAYNSTQTKSSSSGSSSSANRSSSSSGSSWSSGSYGSGGSYSGSSGGSYSGGSVPYSGHTTYGNGDYGGKYLGPNKTSAYQNMENAPGSTGYEKGSLTLRVQKKDDEGNVYYEDETRNGVLPLGTSFRATGSALADAQGVPDSSGIFAYAKGRTPGYIEHASGYKGMGYQDAKGNFYDANGNYIREDNFYYEPGAAISKNGMYQDTGNGWGHAGYGVWGTPGKYIAVQGATYGKAPGTYMGTFGGGGGTYETPAQEETPVQTAPTVEPVIQQIVQAAKTAADRERERRKDDLAAGGGLDW